MKAKWFGLALAVAALSATACGAGRAIFNVDIFSFLQGTGKDTLHYSLPALPVSVSDSFVNPPIAVNLPPGVSSSIVETVRLTGNANIENVTGSGSASFRVFFAADSNPAVLYAAVPGPAISIPQTGTATVTAGGTTPLPFDVPLTAVIADLFKGSKVFIGVRVRVTANAGAGLNGKLRLTALSARVILQDKIF